MAEYGGLAAVFYWRLVAVEIEDKGKGGMMEEKTAIPTRAKGPFVFVVKDGSRVKMVLCNDNKWHIFADLARLIKVDVETLHKRFARWHWSHPEMLKPGRSQGKVKKPVKMGLSVPPGLKGLAALGATARIRNLGKIGGPGSLERGSRKI